MAYYSVLMCIMIVGSALLSMAHAQNCNSAGEDYLEFCLIGLVEYVIFFLLQLQYLSTMHSLLRSEESLLL